MQTQYRVLAIAAALLGASAGFAQAAMAPTASSATVTEIKTGAMIRSSDGKRVGAIERITKDGTGNPVSASVIFDSRFVAIPAATLSGSGRALTTSLSYKDVSHLR